MMRCERRFLAFFGGLKHNQALPEVLLIDGGKGQQVVSAVLTELQLSRQ